MKYYESGQLRVRMHHDEGKWIGGVTYFPNGQLQDTTAVSKSKKWIHMEVYDSTGKQIGLVKNGNGKILRLDKDGSPSSIEIYKDSVIIEKKKVE